MFHNWLQGVDLKLKYKIWVGSVSLCWVIWFCRSNVVFNNARVYTPLQVVFRGTYQIKCWTLLQKEKDINQLKWVCHVLETAMIHIFSNNG
jgi:hypothetical protein